QLGVGEAAIEEARVQLSTPHTRQRRAGKHLVQLDLDQGIALDRARQEVAHAQRRRVEHRSDAQMSRESALEVLGVLLELLNPGEDALRVGEQRAPARRESHAARRALEKAHSERLLERLELAGERRLR